MAAENNSLPDLAQPVSSRFSVQPGSNGITIKNDDANSRLSANIETSQRTGASVGVVGALPIGNSGALGGGVQVGGDKSELFVNLGLRLDERQQLVFTGGQLRQNLDYNFLSGNARAEMTQYSGGASWRFNLGSSIIEHAEANAYTARTASHDLNDVTYAVDTVALYELWNDPRRIAGGKIAGLQGRLGLKPWGGSRLNLGFGQEKLQYDLLGGVEHHNRATGSLGLEQAITGQTRLKAGVDAAAAQNRYSIGIDYRSGAIGTLGINLVNIRSRDNAPHDSRVQLSWTIPLGNGAGRSPSVTGNSATPAIAADGTRATDPAAQPVPASTSRPSRGNAALLDQVAKRPDWMPSQVVAKLDTTATPTRLIAVNKAALPAGSSVNQTTGAITTPLGVVVTGIAGVTLNAAPFTNSGQFSLSGNNLVIDTGKITQPAVGITDTYVVTINNFGGGTTLATVLVSHGSVKIDSITFANGDTTAPTTTGAPAVSGTTDTATTLTATIDENGTGYYLVQAAAAAAPSAATLIAANHNIAMTANTPASVNITGLTASTPYKIYFIAKDAANNVQAAVQSVAVTTGAAPSAPTASAVSISGTAQVGQLLTGSYTYADANNDPQGTTTFRWLRNGVAIAGATASSYTLVVADQGNTITFEVTPVSTVAPATGTPVASGATASVAGVGTPAAPSASAVSISGTAQVGQLLTGSYSYADANNDPQGTTTFRWLRNGVAIAGATASSYTLVAADQGNTITFEVTPVSTVAPATGTTVASGATASVAGVGIPAAPSAGAVSISGIAQVGQLLTGSYTYADANNDPQGATTFRWLRNGAAIAGATASTYTLVAADQGNTITFEVTPVSTVAPVAGTPVVSNATATVVVDDIVAYPYETVFGDVCRSSNEPTPGCTFVRSTGQRVTVSADPVYNSQGFGSDDMWYVQFDSSGRASVFNDIGQFQYYANPSEFAGFIGGTTIGVGVNGAFWENVADKQYWFGKNGVLYSANTGASNYGQAIN